jgi:hypothetical protein
MYVIVRLPLLFDSVADDDDGLVMVCVAIMIVTSIGMAVLACVRKQLFLL